MGIAEGGTEDDCVALRARLAVLEREKAEVDAFAAVAAHELIAPLVMTEAYAVMIAERLDAEGQADSRRDLDALGRGAARVRLLVEALLHEARAGGRQLRRRPVDLQRLVGDCVGLLAPEIASREADVIVEALPEVVGEQALLGGLFTNLLLNALKFSPRHAGVIRVRATREATVWRVAVESDGPTIPEQDRRRIFGRSTVAAGVACAAPASGSRSAGGSSTVTAASSASCRSRAAATASSSRCRRRWAASRASAG